MTGLSGLTVGATYFLGAVGAVAAVAPATAGNIIQPVGKAISATSLEFVQGTPITVGVMATSRYLAMLSGALKMVVPATVSTGTASAGQIVALNPSGKIDSTMLSAAVPNVPRDRTWSMLYANAANSGFDHLGFYSYPLSGNASSGSGTDSLGRQYVSAVSGTTAGNFVQVGYLNPNVSLTRSPSFHITAGITNPATTNTFICGFMANSGGGNFSPAYISAASYADPGKQNDNPMIAFLALAGATYWQCYLSDGTTHGSDGQQRRGNRLSHPQL